MTLKTYFSVLLIALFLALASSLLSLSVILPATIAHFSIALLSSTLTLLLIVRASEGSGAATVVSKERGQVKWFSASKGFGFITRANGEDIFVHFRSISGSGHRILREGQPVEFSVTEGSKGLQAEEVVALNQ